MRSAGRNAWPTLVTVILALLLPQNALDNNLARGGGWNNPAKGGTVMGQQLYTVNRNTGEFQYDRSRAFNDPTYNPWRRNTRGAFDTPPPLSSSVSQPKRGPSVPGPLPTTKPGRRSGGGSYGVSRPSSFHSATYQPARNMSAQRMNLRAPSYRVASTRVR